MKKLFTLVVLALATLTINAQSDKKFTVKVGLGSSSMVGSDSKAYDAAFGFKPMTALSGCRIPTIWFVIFFPYEKI